MEQPKENLLWSTKGQFLYKTMVRQIVALYVAVLFLFSQELVTT